VTDGQTDGLPLAVARSNAALYTFVEFHSDGAANSYVTGTEMKDTFRPDDVDVRRLSCCRPESRYHPDRLQTCIDCHSAVGRHHDWCPLVLYMPPDKPIVEHPYTGPRPTVWECSTYAVNSVKTFIRFYTFVTFLCFKVFFNLPNFF